MAALLNYFDMLESGFCVRINRYARTRAVRSFFSCVSKLGDWYFWAALGALCLAHGNPGTPEFLMRCSVTAAAGILLYKLLKRHLVRERPYVSHAGIVCGTAPLDRYSFPSGHTLHAVSFTVLFAGFEPALLLLAAPFAGERCERGAERRADDDVARSRLVRTAAAWRLGRARRVTAAGQSVRLRI